MIKREVQEDAIFKTIKKSSCHIPPDVYPAFERAIKAEKDTVSKRVFEATFEEECQRRGIKLFVLLGCSPKLNGYVERAHRTHSEEFYEVTESSFDIVELRGELLEWERTYNAIRPHQALGYLTPLKFLEQWRQHKRGEVMCH